MISHMLQLDIFKFMFKIMQLCFLNSNIILYDVQSSRILNNFVRPFPIMIYFIDYSLTST